MSTEWIQIVIACAVIVPLIIITGRYLHWRRWDKERRELRQARRYGLREFYDQDTLALAEKLRYLENPGFSVKT
jgi:hypothetical protein